MTMQYEEIFSRVKADGRGLALVPDEVRNKVLCALADAVIAGKDDLLAANAEDLERMERSNPLYDRLQLTENGSTT